MRFLLAAALLATASAHAGDFPSTKGHRSLVSVPGLHAPVVVLTDVDGVPHIYAKDEHDALFMQGYLQARDRLFQIDVLRRTASGTLAELVGQGALASDVELRTIGLRRAAERSLAAYSPAARAGLQAYSDGVNAWVARNPLPAGYAALEITKLEPWTALDSALIGKALAFQLSFDLDIDATLQYLQYQAVIPQAADALFFLDVFRSAPFDPAASVPDANGPPVRPRHEGKAHAEMRRMHPAAAELLKRYRDRVENVPFLKRTLSRTERQIGSNEWAVSGRFTRNGRPLVANDPHLSLDLPPNFWDVHLSTLDGLDAIGSSVAGTPWVVLGQNRFVTWGETTTGFDVTDTYQESIVPDPTSPSGLSTLHLGQREPVVPVSLAFRVNLRDGGTPDTIVPVPPGGAIPPAALIVPRRNNGPIVQLDAANGVAISVQYAGFSGTRELESFQRMNRARNLTEFKAALQFFDVGSQNFIYGDIHGNIAYFTSGEVPLREDLQAGAVRQVPPWFIRSGQGGHEWIRKAAPGATDGTGYEFLPFDELPQVVNPRSGFVVNANNDPAGVTLDNNPVNQLRVGGSGIYYLGYAFDFGTRAGRITQMLREKLAKGRVDADDMVDIQADVTLLDAQVLAPYIARAFDNAKASSAPPELRAFVADGRIAEAVRRLDKWDSTAPTGVDVGYDGSDRDGDLARAKRREIDASIAATIYSVWRGQAIRNGVDRRLQTLGVPTPGSGEAIKALRHLLERDGIGLSAQDFFGWAGLGDPADRRDFVVLQSLKDALDLLAGPAFAAAFNGSTDQNDYRWGKLHRITFDGIVLGGPTSIPGATPGFPPSFDGLPGIAADGGFGVVDASSHNARSASASAFTFGSGPNRRYVGSPDRWPGHIDAQSILPGGESGIVGNEFYANQLGRWLTNDTYEFRQQLGDVLRALDSSQLYKPE